MSFRRAVIFSSLERYYSFVLAFATSVVISRLLTPAEVGVFSVAMSLTGVAAGLRDFGASSYLMRSERITKEHESCAFGITLLLGGGLGLILLLSAEPLSAFLGGNDTAGIIRILSISFFLLPFGTVNNALVQRNMRYDLVARIGVVSSTLGFAISVAAAWFGLGSYSLAWGSVIPAAISALLYMVWGPSEALIWPRLKGAPELIRFGAQSTGLSVIWDLSARYPDFILGKLQGFAAAGLMSRAIGAAANFNDLLLKGVSSVALPYFAKAKREDGNPVADHLSMATLATGLGWPMFISMAVFAEPLTLALYGEKWLGIVWPLQIICLQYLIGLPFSFQVPLVIAVGRIDRQVKASLVTAAVRLPLLTVGAFFGPIGVAIALVAGLLAGLFISSRFVWPVIGVTITDYLKVAKTNIPVATAALAGCWLAISIGTERGASPATLLLEFAPLGLVPVIIAYLLFRHPLIAALRPSISRQLFRKQQ